MPLTTPAKIVKTVIELLQLRPMILKSAGLSFFQLLYVFKPINRIKTKNNPKRVIRISKMILFTKIFRISVYEISFETY